MTAPTGDKLPYTPLPPTMMGWQCPKCGMVYAPMMESCSCSVLTITTTGTTTTWIKTPIDPMKIEPIPGGISITNSACLSCNGSGYIVPHGAGTNLDPFSVMKCAICSGTGKI